MRKLLLILLVVSCAKSFGQHRSGTVLSDSLWLYQEGDNPTYALPDFDDRQWDAIVTYLEPEAKMPSMEGIVWFRKRFTVPDAYKNEVIGCVVNQAGGSEIFLDGKLVKRYGMPSDNPEEEVVYNPNMGPFPIFLDSADEHVIAVRFSNSQYKDFQEGNDGAGFALFLGNFEDLKAEFVMGRLIATGVLVFLGTFFLTLGILHLIIYLFYRKKRNNLFYSLFMFCSASFCYIPEFAMNSTNPAYATFLIAFLRYVVPIFMMSFLSLLYTLFYTKLPKVFWVFLSIVTLTIILLFSKSAFGYMLSALFSLAVFIESFRVSLVAIIRKKRGAWIVGGGVIFLLLTILGIFIAGLSMPDNNISISGNSLAAIALIGFLVLAVLSLPISMSIYLAWDISQTSSELEKKLVEVQELSEKTIQQEKEKKKILEEQNVVLEKEVQERTREIREQKEKIEEVHQEITDSISYAKRIQSAILPPQKLVRKYLPESFILYKPKDIVAGDFYWMETTDDAVLFAAADCTGHGVPGAMVSVVCNNGLNRSVREYGLTDPGKILDKTREIVIQEFAKSEEEVKDGMDIALCSLRLRSDYNEQLEQNNEESDRGLSGIEPHHEQDDDMPSRGLSGVEVHFAGAHNPLWIIRKGATEVEEVKGNKQPIGKFDKSVDFETHVIELAKGDTIYLFSDGFSDQFGGEKGKKFKAKNFKKLLLSVCDKPMDDQQRIIDESFEEWRGTLEQLDDVCVIGVRI
ncbi:MAG: SpoIIE family protein phosphatase [Crocinitomicaceae bacterium]|nr:SpoIIE family protein phosphatase [Crocinitomicaceae bacterium]